MPFEYSTNLTSVYNVLKAHNTTTASPDLSASLTTRILDENILMTDPEIVMQRGDRLPAIFLRISNKDEEFQGIGKTGNTSDRVRKKGILTYDIIGFYGKEGGHDSHANVMTEIYAMARNIEGVFHKEFDLSGTALWCNPMSTDFFGPFQISGSWVKTVFIKVQASYLFR